jgi:cytochrome bd-type quinol oxidase subunit 1
VKDKIKSVALVVLYGALFVALTIGAAALDAWMPDPIAYAKDHPQYYSHHLSTWQAFVFGVFAGVIISVLVVSFDRERRNR